MTGEEGRSEGVGMTQRFECYDGMYRFICEAGHTTITSKAWLDLCPAVVNEHYEPALSGRGDPCGAVIEARVIPYLERGEENPDA